MYEVEMYQKANGKRPVEEYIKLLRDSNNTEELERIRLFVGRLKDHGMNVNSVFPHTIRKESPDGIWELRPGGSRVFFFHFTGKKFVLLHAFKKQGQKAPPSEIDKAIKEMKEYRRRHKDEQQQL